MGPGKPRTDFNSVDYWNAGSDEGKLRTGAPGRGPQLADCSSIQCYLGYTLAKSGKRDEALGLSGKLKTTKEYVSPTELAVLYAGLGDKEQALASLEKAYAAHDLQLQYLKVSVEYDFLRTDPRFQDLLRRVGLPQ